MKTQMFFNKAYTLFLIMGFCLVSTMSIGQETEREYMAKLSFLMGDWKGESKGFTNGVASEPVIAYEKIQYLLDGDIMTLDLDSPKLKLHTVINYSLADSCYYYTPFTKSRSSKFKGQIDDKGRFLVYFNESRHLIFERTPEGAFHEYGEQLKDGKWEKYFEDLFYPTSKR